MFNSTIIFVECILYFDSTFYYTFVESKYRMRSTTQFYKSTLLLKCRIRYRTRSTKIIVESDIDIRRRIHSI